MGSIGEYRGMGAVVSFGGDQEIVGGKVIFKEHWIFLKFWSGTFKNT